MSGGYIAYNLRPNKAVDRHLFIDLLSKVNRKFPISNYLYVGFGGTHFEDFKLMHTYFDNKKMISLEGDKNVNLRQKLNIPFKFIDARLEKSDHFITHYNAIDNCVFWLDYANANQYLMQLNEIFELLSKSKVGDIIKVTLNANPYSWKIPTHDSNNSPLTLDEKNIKRIEVLKAHLDEYLPHEPTDNDVSVSGLPAFLSHAIGVVASKALGTRMDHGRVKFQPLSCFHYADGEHQMMTFTGILIEKRDFMSFFRLTELIKWPLSSLRWGESQKIIVPNLTVKEKQIFDRNMPFNMGSLNFKFNFDNRTSNLEYYENYVKYYRYYQSFHRVSF